jgi:putative SOS response-associated peptidase YedK
MVRGRHVTCAQEAPRDLSSRATIHADDLQWEINAHYIPYWCKDPTGGRKPINAKCETVARLPTFRDTYRRRGCIGQ